MKLYGFGPTRSLRALWALHELGLDFEFAPVNLVAGEAQTTEFLRLNAAGKLPVLVDGDLVLTESAAIVLYLAEKYGRFGGEGAGRWSVIEWLMWQMGGLGPMAGQAHHFLKFNPGKAPYAEDRYATETRRLYGVLDHRLAGRDFIADEYSIADMACWPWVSRFEWQGIDLGAFPHVRDWYRRIADRPAVRRGYAVPKDTGPIPMP